MINLKQFVKLIPYYQDYEVWYSRHKFDDYVCVLDGYADAADKIDIVKYYGKCPVKHVEAGRAEILHIFLKEGSLNNE